MHRRKPLLISLIAVVATFAMLSASCTDIGSFRFSEESNEITVQGTSSPLDDLLPTRIPMEVDLEQELEEQNASGARSVHLNDLYFEMTENTEEEHFDFMDEITIRVDSESHEERELAWNEDIPEGQDRFELEIDEDLDLKPYAEEGLDLRTSVQGSNPSEDAKFKVYAEFRVRIL